MAERLFGTDGARGPVGQYPINCEGAYDLGRAAADVLELQGQTLIAGGDTRGSTPELLGAFAAGVAEMGGNVEIINRFTTPGIAVRVRDTDAAGGVSITASHNMHSRDDPTQRMNGIKILKGDGYKLTDDEEDAIEQRLARNGFALPAQRGKIITGTREEHVEAYLQHLTSRIEDRQILTGQHVVLDMANGAAVGFASELAIRLGADKVTEYAASPDGYNINVNSGAQHPEHAGRLIVKASANVGAALDGDADRGYLIDETGQPVDGDTSVYINAVVGQHKHVALTSMTNGGVVASLAKQGVETVRTAVGDRYVLEAMLASQGPDSTSPITLGGEKSAHVIFSDLGPGGDGMATFMHTVDAAQRSGRPLSHWRQEVEDNAYPQILVSIPVADKAAVMSDPRVLELQQQALEAVGPAGRVNLRPSGTGHEVRFMVESKDPAVVNKYAREFGRLINENFVAA